VNEPRWLRRSVVLAIHADQINSHGGSYGLRDPGLLESAMDRPRNRFVYEPDSDLCSLASAYGFALANNHPFIDGNKRVAFQAMYVFLGLNGLRIQAQEEEVVSLMLGVAGGSLSEAQLTSWLRANTVSR